jgi:hypothetical protein
MERGLLILVSIIEEVLERKGNGSGLESLDYRRKKIRRADNPLSANVGINFADKGWSLGWYNPVADSGHGVCLLFVYLHIQLFRSFRGT